MDADSFTMQLLDGNTHFNIPQDHLAETFFDGIWYYACNHCKENEKNVIFYTKSKELVDIYVEIFRLKKNLGGIKVSSKQSNLVNKYSLDLKEHYDSHSGGRLMNLYKLFVSCEKNFSTPKNPVLLSNVKKFLLETQYAKEKDIESIINIRNQECLQFIQKTYDKFKNSTSSFFKEIFVDNLQFSKEIIVKQLNKFHESNPNFIEEKRFKRLLAKYTGEDILPSTDLKSSHPIIEAPIKAIDKKKTALRHRSTSMHRKMPKQNSTVVIKSTPDRSIYDILTYENNNLLRYLFDSLQPQERGSLIISLLHLFNRIGKSQTYFRVGIETEVDKTSSVSTLFRTNSMISRSMTDFVKFTSTSYLSRLVMPTFKRILSFSKALEVDDNKIKDAKQIKKNRKELLTICSLFIDDLLESYTYATKEILMICSELKNAVSKKFPESVNITIAGFLILRYISPSFISPEAFGITLEKTPNPEQKRTILLVTKVIQNLANLVEFKKEAYMLDFNELLLSKFDEVSAFYEKLVSMSTEYKPSKEVIEISSNTTNEDVNNIKEYLKYELPIINEKLKDPLLANKISHFLAPKVKRNSSRRIIPT